MHFRRRTMAAHSRWNYAVDLLIIYSFYMKIQGRTRGTRETGAAAWGAAAHGGERGEGRDGRGWEQL